jgi:hypothetical protein
MIGIQLHIPFNQEQILIQNGNLKTNIIIQQKIINLILITLNKLRKFKNKNKRYKIKLIVGFSLAKKIKTRDLEVV